MKYRLLGKSGLRVSEAALGTMTFGEEWGWGSPKAEAQKVGNASMQGTGSYLIFFRNGVFQNNVNCVATTIDPSNNVAPISSMQIALQGPGGILINSVGVNGLIPTDFDLVCSGN
jgi:hypothetical protein